MNSIIDTHTHAWNEQCLLIDDRRYTPSQSHSMDMLQDQMKDAGIEQAVLVQPSFLGTNNDYLLKQLKLFPNTLKGVVVVEPDIEHKKFLQWVSIGVTGIRLNIFGSSISGEELVAQYAGLMAIIRESGCHLEIHTSGDHWVKILPALLSCNVDIVIDHFGRPNSDMDLGFNTIIDSIDSGKIWIKLSGWYRFEASPKKLTKRFLDASSQRLVWGSDYPWTQHEQGRSYEECLGQLKEWVDNQYLEDVLIHNPRVLYKF